VSFIVLALPLAGVTEWLAWVAARDDVDFLNFSPIHLGDVPQVGHAGVVGLHDLAGRWLNLGVPGQVATHGQIQSAVAAEQAADLHATHSKKLGRWA
jgi:hypothetical protein